MAVPLVWRLTLEDLVITFERRVGCKPSVLLVRFSAPIRRPRWAQVRRRVAELTEMEGVPVSYVEELVGDPLDPMAIVEVVAEGNGYAYRFVVSGRALDAS